MAMLGTKSKLSSIGLDVDAHEFRAVQLMESGDELRLIASAIFPRRESHETRDPDALPSVDELEWATAILGRRGFVGTNTSITLPTAQCSSHIFELPPASSGAPVEQLAKIEVARSRKCAPTEIELGHWELPAKGRTQETLAVAFPKALIDHAMERYDESGLTLAGIDLLELAVSRGAHTGSVIADNEINATLHVGWTCSLAVLTLGKTVIYVRRIEHGVDSVWQAARDRYKLSEQSADAVVEGRYRQDCSKGSARLMRATWTKLAASLAAELDVAVAYVSHSFRMAPFGKIHLSGYGSTNPMIDEHIDKLLGIPIECAAPPSLMGALGQGPQAWAMASRLSAAYGLAARVDR